MTAPHEREMQMPRKFLHVGCGVKNKTVLKGFNSDEWIEIRFDIDKNVNPDIVGTLTDMSQVESESVDAVYSSHNIEHLYAHEVGGALREFRRVLKPEGFVVITCPDLQLVCESVVNDKLAEPLYVSPSGPISPLDILYGHGRSIAQGNTYMAHKCGFTYSLLKDSFLRAGFVSTIGGRRPKAFELWLAAFKTRPDEAEMHRIGGAFLP